VPGAEAAYGDEKGGDLYPSTPEEHSRQLRWALESLVEAERARLDHEDQWKRQYRMYRSFVERPKNDWRSKMFVPLSFYVIETITPKLVAQLPKMVVDPVGEEDVAAAELLEDLLEWSAEQAGLYEQLVACYRSGLKYGTGIIKTYYEVRTRRRRQQTELMEQTTRSLRSPVMDPSGNGQMLDTDRQPVYDETTEPLGERPYDPPRYESEIVEYPIYSGPVAEAIDIMDFWPAPEATNIENARYVIHRVFRDDRHVRQLLDEGKYRMPDGHRIEDEELWSSQVPPHIERLEEIGLSAGTDPTRRRAELHEFWTDDTQITLLNKRVIVRVASNPYDHGEKPFVRILDHYQEHEFWGVGELEPLEGVQDGINALWNQRIDNIRLILNKIFVGDPSKLHDLRDLLLHPGAFIRTKGNVPPREAIDEFEMSDVTASAYTETAELERLSEKISGVSAYQTGTDSPTLNDTATGVALISEQGNSRFALKVRMAEITGLVRLARHFGMILQQFMPEELSIRRQGPEGQYTWEQVTAEGIMGELDYDIEAESSTVTESVRKEQKMSLMDLAMNVVDPMTGQPVANVRKFFEDVLREFGYKNLNEYMIPEMGPQGILGGMLGGGGAPAPPPPGSPEALLAAAGGIAPTPGSEMPEQVPVAV